MLMLNRIPDYIQAGFLKSRLADQIRSIEINEVIFISITSPWIFHSCRGELTGITFAYQSGCEVG